MKFLKYLFGSDYFVEIDEVGGNRRATFFGREFTCEAAGLKARRSVGKMGMRNNIITSIKKL